MALLNSNFVFTLVCSPNCQQSAFNYSFEKITQHKPFRGEDSLLLENSHSNIFLIPTVCVACVLLCLP